MISKRALKTTKMRQIPYQEVVGGPTWVVTMTRPDLSVAIHQLAKLSDDPGPMHWKASRKVLQYMWRTRNLIITYGGEREGSAKLSVWVDADHGSGTVMIGGGYLVCSRESRKWRLLCHQSLNTAS